MYQPKPVNTKALFEHLYNQIVENGDTPRIETVKTPRNCQYPTEVLQQYYKTPSIPVNIRPDQTAAGVFIDEDGISFSTRFNRVSYDLQFGWDEFVLLVPVAGIFPFHPFLVAAPEKVEEPKPTKPALRVVK